MKHDPILHRWVVDRSHMAAVPTAYYAGSLDALKKLITSTADGKKRKPIVGLLEFTHLVRDGQEVLLVHFRHHKTNKKLRFMRLIREH